MREPDGKGNGGCPIEGVWDRRAMRGERAEWAFRGPREVKSPEDGPRPPRAVVSVVIQEGRMDETKETRQRGGGAEKAGEKGGGCRGMRPWSRYIRAPVPCLCQGICVFMWNTGEPHRCERDGKKKRKREGGRGKERERERARRERERSFSCEREGRGRRKEPMASQGVLPFRYEGASRYTRESIRLCSKNTRKQTTAIPPSSPPHRHTATPPIAHFSSSSPSFSFSRAAPVTLVSLLFLSLFLAPLRSSKFHRGVSRP